MNDLKEFFKDKKVLITGHTGFKGSWLTQIMLEFGAKVIGISLEPNTDPSLFKILKLESQIKNYYQDIRKFKKIKAIFENEKPEIVFHLAAQPIVRLSYDDPITTYETNIIGTVNLIEAVKAIKSVKSCVLITTDKVYNNKEWIWSYRENDTIGSNPDPYSTSKACAELIIESYLSSFFNPNKFNKDHNTLIAAVRAGNVIGGGDWAKDRLMTDIIRNIFEKNKTIILRSPKAIRPWQHVLEPLYGYMLLSKKLFEENISFAGAWNFGPDENNFICVEDLLKKGISYLNKGNYTIQEDTKKHEANILKLDSSKAKLKLNWKACLNIDKTLKWTFDWYTNFYAKEDMIKLTKEQINLFFKG